MPGTYGEIFLTNRYGVMIATTGKLTTLAHAHKYWWVAAYADGQGRDFLDDRGFDTSVEGYVLGVVIPIKDGNEIIGILKCNVNIEGPLTDIVNEFIEYSSSKLQIIRSGGLVVADGKNIPLSIRADSALIGLLQRKIGGSATVSINNENQLIAYAPIPITMGSEKAGFGGKGESIDHIKGNEGEGWHVSISSSEQDVFRDARDTTLTIISFGIIFTFLIAIIALVLGRWAARPIIELSTVAEKIGAGDLNATSSVDSNDEIGLLGKSLNKMAKNLNETMASRDELHQSEHLLKESQKIANLGSYSFDILSGVWNRSEILDQILGMNDNYSKDVQGWLNILRPDERDDLNDYLNDHVLLKHNFFDKEYRIIRPSDGEERWVHGLGKLELDANDNPIKLVGTIQDITDRKKSQEQLLEAQKMAAIGTLVGGIAHDFNNKLAAITGTIFMAKKEAVELPHLTEQLNTVEALSYQVAKTIKNLLTYTQKEHAAAIPISLRSCIQKALETNGTLIPENAVIHVDTPKEELMIKGTTLQLSTAFKALLKNAFDAVADVVHPMIQVKAEAFKADEQFKKDHADIDDTLFAHLEIIDNGSGITGEDLTHVFEPFFTTKGIEEGQGLGLSLAYGIIRSHNGIIEINSSSDLGTSVHVYLPLIDED
ncbi:MAG: ATP-binding protein [Mariprofundaceae bacterium]